MRNRYVFSKKTLFSHRGLDIDFYCFFDMYIIGIAGGTASGKTTVVREIVNSLPKGEVVVIPQDSYYKDSSHVPVEERQFINFDHPDAFDWELMVEQLTMLRNGQAVEQPTYSYITCTRQPETIYIEPRKIIIIEGIMALVNPELRELMDLKVFVDADADDRLIRLIRRDIIERGRTPETVISRYERIVKAMHQEFIEPTKQFADIIITQGGSNEKAIKALEMAIQYFLNK